VKICCLKSRQEAATAVRLGATAVGLVSAMPSGPGPIPETRISEIAAGLPRGIRSVLLTSLTDPDEIAAQQERCGVTTIQICDRLVPGAHRRLRELRPGIELIQVVHVLGAEALGEARSVAAAVDGILLDSGDPAAPRKQLGGTGRIHDWRISRRIVQGVPVPVYLAGGLTPSNVADAIATAGPAGVDVCTGVRTAGLLDEKKVAAFIARARSGSTPR